jgi:hypothetical protein
MYRGELARFGRTRGLLKMMGCRMRIQAREMMELKRKGLVNSS